MLKRLLQKSVYLFILKPAADFGVAIAAADYHRQLRMQSANGMEGLLAVETRHVQVEQHQGNAVASPKPRPVNLVVKKGSKIRFSSAGSMPWPLSRTSRATYSPGASSPDQSDAGVSRRSTEARTTTTPSRSGGMASLALMMRFM